MAVTDTQIRDLDLEALARAARLERSRHLAAISRDTAGNLRRLWARAAMRPDRRRQRADAPAS